MRVADRITVLRQGRVVGATHAGGEHRAGAGGDDGGPGRPAGGGQASPPARPRGPGCGGPQRPGRPGHGGRRRSLLRGARWRDPGRRRRPGQRPDRVGRGHRGLRPAAHRGDHPRRHGRHRRPPGELFRAGIGHVPEDRQADGLVGPFSVADNMVLNTYDWPEYSRGPVRDREAVRARAEQLTGEDFDVRTASVETPAGTLSGGNQQKVIVAREFTHAQRLLMAVAADPRTRRRVDPVHPRADRGRAGRRRRGADRLRGARRGPGPGRPGGRHVRGPVRRGCWRATTSTATASACSWPATLRRGRREWAGERHRRPSARAGAGGGGGARGRGRGRHRVRRRRGGGPSTR